MFRVVKDKPFIKVIRSPKVQTFMERKLVRAQGLEEIGRHMSLA